MPSYIGLMVGGFLVFVMWTQIISPLLNSRKVFPFFSEEAKLEQELINLKERRRVRELKKQLAEKEKALAKTEGNE